MCIQNPALIENRKITIETHVIECDLPMQLSRTIMQMANTMIRKGNKVDVWQWYQFNALQVDTIAFHWSLNVFCWILLFSKRQKNKKEDSTWTS